MNQALIVGGVLLAIVLVMNKQKSDEDAEAERQRQAAEQAKRDKERRDQALAGGVTTLMNGVGGFAGAMGSLINSMQGSGQTQANNTSFMDGEDGLPSRASA